MKAKPIRECPCHSGKRYQECCAPFHREEREAETPEGLMRSRYSAFALGLGEYLVKTLSSSHEDRALPEQELIKALSSAKREQRYLGLTIEHTSEQGNVGEVLFHARIFSKGEDRSFSERSRFVKEAGAWRYDGGEMVPRESDALAQKK